MTGEPPSASGSLPVLGHTVSLLRSPLSALTRWGERAADLVGLRVAGRQFCLVTSSTAIEQVLATQKEQYQKAEILRDRLGRLQGNSLVLLEGEEWEDQRALLRPAFGPSQQLGDGQLTTQLATDMVEAWPTDRPVRAREELQTLTLTLLAQALFGLDLRGEETAIHEAADDIMARMDLRSPSAYLPVWMPTPTNYRFKRAIEGLHERLDAEIGACEEGTEANLLSIMRSAGLSDEIRDELIALLFAGYDSTATALSLTLGLLGDNSSVQADLHRELQTAFGTERPTSGAVADLPLLDAVVRESLRLYPPQYLLFRQPVQTVSLCGYRIDPETTLLIPPWVVQRDPAFWSEPTEFRPQRWLEESDQRASHEFAYLPYGGGPRHCLGVHLANQTIKLVLAVLVQRRQCRLRGSLSVRAGPTLMPDPIEIRAFDRGN